MSLTVRRSLQRTWSYTGFFLGTALLLSAQSTTSKKSAGPAKPPEVLQKYCFECHGGTKPEAGLSIQGLLSQPSIGAHPEAWEKVAAMLESGDMPPSDADAFPSDGERKAASTWVRSTLKTYEREHGGEPGRVTVRRLTSGEYAYAIRDLTGIDIDTGIDSSSDSVGGEGFTNFGDVQFIQDANLEHYLEAAKRVADHAVIGAGPLEFYQDTGRTGLELFALNRINELHAAHGFRVVSGEGGRPYGLETYSRAFYAAWHFKHRAALGEPKVTLQALAARNGVTARFAEHIWAVVNQPKLGYPSNGMVARWAALPAPTANVAASIEKSRAGCTELQNYLIGWPSWFFGRGDVAAGGAGDESPLVFNDTSLKVVPTYQYTFQLSAAAGARNGRGRGDPAAAVPVVPGAPLKVYLTFADLNPRPGVKPVVIWRNPRIVTRAGAGAGGGGFRGRGGAGGAAAGNEVVPAGAVVVDATGQAGADAVNNGAAGQAGAVAQNGAGPGPVGINPGFQGGNGRRGGGGFGRGGRGRGGANANATAANGATPAVAVAVAAGAGAAVPDGGAAAANDAGADQVGNNNNLAGQGANGRRGANAGPILSTQPLREVLPAEIVAQLGFGKSIDGSEMKPEDFAATDTVSFEIKAPAAGTTAELQVDAELGADRNGVVKLVITNRLDGPPARGAQARVFIGDPESAGYKTFRAGIAEYVSLLPPNSHGEANPADKDPVPLPFDSTFNTPEHDAFVLKVKYQRTDQFLAANLLDAADRTKLEQAWNNLFDAFPYHDNYLGLLAEHYEYKLPTTHVSELTPAQLAAMPAEMRPEVEKLRAEFAALTKAQIDAEPQHIENALTFASRAWRRPLTRTEKSSLRAFYQSARRENGLDHDRAIKAVITRVLVSPAFIYRAEPVANNRERPLTDWEMASRLSFFLWSSIPDDELRRAAEAGELTKPDTLAKQVRRMTADPKARRLGAEFFGQWLGFYHFDAHRGVDTGHFPEFTSDVQAAMYDEAISTFEYLVRENRPVRELLHADYTFINQPLAKFYGIDRELPAKDGLTRLDGASALNRGGALRLGAVLTVTSAPLRTSPVKRGDWVLRRILGSPTPPPPANAGTLPADPKTFGDLTLREKLNEHKNNPSCAACHVKIDPLGFPLEGFDAVGRVRTAYDDGKPVDTTGEMADKRTLLGAGDLLKYLTDREPQVMRTLSKKMLGYALGRTVLASDRALVDEMTAAGGSASFADLAVKVATSRQFRNRAADQDPAASSFTSVSASGLSPGAN
jgi:hypothetical protein